MKIRTLLKIQEAVEGRATPYDMEDEYHYYSKSKNYIQHYLDMDLIHFIRVARKHLLTPEQIDKIDFDN